jgi:hypothetical protein
MKLALKPLAIFPRKFKVIPRANSNEIFKEKKVLLLPRYYLVVDKENGKSFSSVPLLLFGTVDI